MVATRRAVAVDPTVGALIDGLATECPDAPFIIDLGCAQTLTFAALRRQTAALAVHLQQLGLVHGDRVCIAMDNGLAAVLSHLGVMRAGFVAVPIDPGGGASQLRHILRHCEARAILVADERRAQIEPIAAELNARVEPVDVGSLACAPINGKEEALPALGPNDDALLMYTSGSTGLPKGVLLSHAEAMARAAAGAAVHEIGPADRLLCVLPLYHMSALNMMLGVLYSGSSMVVAPRFQVARYWGWVISYRCTWLGMAPTFVTQLLRWGETHAGPPPTDLRHVRFARSSSAPLSDTAHHAFEERFGIVLVQGMGMTEAGPIFFNPPHREQRRIGSLGRARTLEVKLVDGDESDIGCGRIGELMVRGRGVVRSYYKDPEATATAFDAAGWLRTGDLVYQDQNGYFFHAGRAKDLIIKGGTNVAPRAVDEALESHPDVAQAAAVGVPDPTLGEDIGAYVVLRPGARCSERTLLDHCAARLDEFKTPSWITFVDSLPTGPTGKVQRAQLVKRAAEQLRPDADAWVPAMGDAAVIPPHSAVERAIAAAWTEVLGSRPRGIHDNFFALGGSSLLALRVTARLRQSLGVQLSLGAILRAPTISAQARIVAERQRCIAAGDARRDEGAASDLDRAVATQLTPDGESQGAVPLFCLHSPFRFSSLAALLGPQHPIYGVSIGPAIAAIGGNQPISTFSTYTIEELARLCLVEIRRVQPAGPYQLGGFSFGGRVALEVARQLRAVGEEVEILVIFDTYLPGTFRPRPLRGFTYHLAELLRHGPRHVSALARRRWARYRGVPGTPPPDETDEGAMVEYREAAFRRSLGARYRPRPYSGNIVLFRTTGNQDVPHYRKDPLRAWKRIARGKLSVHDVPSVHLEILNEPYTGIVAEALRPYLKI